jgi:hypothetical protein
MAKLGYKAVRVYRDGSRRSLYRFVSDTLSCTALEYTQGHRTTRPKACGPMAVFTRLKNAVAFSTDCNTEVWGIEYEPSSDHSLWDCDISLAAALGVAGTGLFPHFLTQSECPPGTDFADSVTLLKRVF